MHDAPAASGSEEPKGVDTWQNYTEHKSCFIEYLHWMVQGRKDAFCTFKKPWSTIDPDQLRKNDRLGLGRLYEAKVTKKCASCSILGAKPRCGCAASRNGQQPGSYGTILQRGILTRGWNQSQAGAPPPPNKKVDKGTYEKLPCLLCEKLTVAPKDHLGFRHGIDTPVNRYVVRWEHIVRTDQDVRSGLSIWTAAELWTLRDGADRAKEHVYQDVRCRSQLCRRGQVRQ